MKVQAIYNNKFLKKGLEFASDNGALFVGTTSLILSTVARPIAIMSTPKTDKENRKYATAKSLASSAIGYGLMLFASLPLAKSVKKINENPSKYLKNETIKALQNGEKTLDKSKKYKFATQLFKLGLGFVVAVPKSILTCAMIPMIMGKFFNNEKLSEASPLLGRGLGRGEDFVSSKQSISPSLEFVSSHSFTNKFFSLPWRDRRHESYNNVTNPSTLQPFNPSTNNYPSPQPSPSRGEGACDDSRSTSQLYSNGNLSEKIQTQYSDTVLSPYRPIALSPDNKNISTSFTGTTDKIAKGIGKMLDTTAVKKLTEKFHNTNFEMHIMALTDTLATGTFITQTAKSKKIDEDRKKALMYNAGISTGLCIAGGYAVDRLTKKPTDKFIKKFREANKNSPKLEKYIEGIKIVKPALILGSLYYIAIPLISTFLAERFDKKITKDNL